MTLVADPLKRAHGVTTARQAAALRDKLEVELALNDELDPDWEDEADRAVAVLKERYPDLDERFEHGEAAGVPTISRGARRGLEPRDGREAGSGGNGRPSRDTPVPSGGRPPRSARRQRVARQHRRRRAGGRAARRAWQETGIPQTGRQTTQLVMAIAGGALMLSLVYRLLRDAERPGRSAVEALSGLFAGGLQLIFSPQPPLSGARLTERGGYRPAGASPPPALTSRPGQAVTGSADAVALALAKRRRSAPAPGPASALPRRPAGSVFGPLAPDPLTRP